MPQMAPLNWTLLWIFFIILYLFFWIINYYLFIYKPSKSNKPTKKKKLFWKW
uniref:ATP synthase F0 subunit 8 n=1 Tax=Cyrtotrachelus buqueti TaxID=1892066 RepID=A0A346T602_9CUCU|nr:ATP synthase F0 subunit 8 [Cyrtotrachelus buqueti]AXU05685.1 ATP synthase F0 subunit 8 [Cyrtotrachelus buqueti]